MISASLSLALMTSSSASDRLLAQMDADYWDAERRLYLDDIKEGRKGGSPAFNWGVGVMLSALNSCAEKSPEAKRRLIEYLPAVKSYWNSAGPVPGFDVLPTPKPVDRYYDDNAWMVMALLETSRVLKQPELKELALKSLDYSLSGWAEERGGGIYWRESDKASRNTCSCSPTAAACFMAFRATGKASYKQWAIKILDWTLKNLQDPSDGLMWDALGNDGKIEKTKWSYNTALTARALLDAEEFGYRAKVSGRALFVKAWNRWFSPSGAMKDPGRFTHLLVDVGLDYDLITLDDKKALIRYLVSMKDETGRYGDRWDQVVKGAKRHELIDQASVLRTLARLGV